MCHLCWKKFVDFTPQKKQIPHKDDGHQRIEVDR